MIEVGDEAPDAPFEMADANIGRISDHRGSPLVLYFYPKDDTPGCTREAQDFSGLAADFARAGVSVLGVSKDSAKKHRSFVAKHDLQVSLGADPDGAVCEAYGVWIEKSMYGRSYMGIERATFLIDAAGRIARIWHKVKVPGHAQEVLAAALALK